MVETYPNETLNWTSYSGYITDGRSFDTGGTIVTANINHSSATNTYVAPTTAGYQQTGLPYGTKTMMSQAAAGQTTNTTFTFNDDPAAPGTVNTAENLSFTLYGIDKASMYTDSVTLRAVDAEGNAIPISVTAPANATYTVTYNPDGSVVLTGTSALSTSAPQLAAAGISFGGPVDSFTLSHASGGGSSQIYMSDFGFTPSSATQAVCFVAGTMIRTAQGEVAVEDLCAGDLVMTRDNGLQPIRWIGASRQRLAPGSPVQPVRIRAGALGQGVPRADLLVSPQHRMLVRSAIARKMFGTDEILVAAKQLQQIDGIGIADALREVVYVHFLFDTHQIVYANGAESESLFAGAEALKLVGRKARAEIYALFPELRALGDGPVPARLLASGRLGRKLAVRHAQNAKPLIN